MITHHAVARLCIGSLKTPAGRGGARRLASCAVSAHYRPVPGDAPSGATYASSNNGAGATPSRRALNPEASKRVGRALQALKLEESRGHCDVRGVRSLFSEFAASELVRLGDVLPPGGSRDRWQRTVAAGFSRYRDLAPPQRANLVAEAQFLLVGADATRPLANPASVGESTTSSSSSPSPAASPSESSRASSGGGFWQQEMRAGGRDASDSTSESSVSDEDPGASSSLADFHSKPPRDRGKPGGKASVYGSASWESALAQVFSQREEVNQVKAPDAMRAMSSAECAGGADSPSGVFAVESEAGGSLAGRNKGRQMARASIHETHRERLRQRARVLARGQERTVGGEIRLGGTLLRERGDGVGIVQGGRGCGGVQAPDRGGCLAHALSRALAG